ncbi:hypothetical protein JCM19037_4385 [Geomicrobium sp. JCM 19037]|nr:hypothetical protein JCM19037_4385 [Geomicrobium sp. JCM 19037]
MPDARKFVEKAKSEGVDIHYIEAPKMVHIYPIFNFPEALKATEQIIDVLKEAPKAHS